MNGLTRDLTTDEHDRTATAIESTDNPVGVDAEKAHAITLHKLTALERRLNCIEEQLAADD